jgi:hypothetical protein
MTPDEIVKKFQALQSQRKVAEEAWQAIELFVCPYRGKFFRDAATEGAIEWRRRNIYDSTAIMAHQSLSSSLHGSLTNPAIRWFDMQWRDKALQQNHSASVWLETASKKVYDTLQDSNFNLEINETYRDLTSFGTSFLIQEPTTDAVDTWQGVEFTSIPLKEGYFEPDATGGARVFYRHMQWTASKIVDKFGKDNVPEKVKTALDNAADETFDIVFCVYPRDIGRETTKKRVLPAKERPYGYKYICLQSKHEYLEGGYYEMPAYVPRWLTTSESVWGNSPAHVALADILTLNQMVELSIKAVEKLIDPAILTNERNLLADLDLGPGEVNKVRDVDKIKMFESTARYDVFTMKQEDLRMAINRYFFIDQLELKDSPAMTATEVQVRYELMQRLLSATMSRLRHDLLDPLIQRTFNLLYRSGEFGGLPEGVTDSDLDIEYIGPLSRSQRFDQSASLDRWLAQLQAIAAVSPRAEQVLMVPDWEAVARHSARNLNLPTELLRSKDDVVDEMADQQNRTNRAEEAAIANDEASAAVSLAKAGELGGQPPAPTQTM